MTRTVLVPGYVVNDHAEPIYLPANELARRHGLVLDGTTVVRFDGKVLRGDEFIFANDLIREDLK